jgi:hypothetical protein
LRQQSGEKVQFSMSMAQVHFFSRRSVLTGPLAAATAIALLLILLTTARHGRAAEASKQPNVILIMADDI